VSTRDDQAYELEEQVGHPAQLWESLKDHVQADAVKSFAGVQEEWLQLMWSLDAFRVRQLIPIGMGVNPGAVNRFKGNWFAELIALLLQNRTSQRIGARTRVQGFSQLHQIDVAWPVRQHDPLICAETKVTGAPAYGSTPSRAATADWTNRRKELKFAATDLKLYRRQQETTIDHWDVWRKGNPPRVFFLWAARITDKRDRIDYMIREVRSLIETYLDGAGFFAWEERKTEDGYQALSLPADARVAALDDVLHRIASEIRLIAPAGEAPEPVVPEVSVAVAEPDGNE